MTKKETKKSHMQEHRQRKMIAVFINQMAEKHSVSVHEISICMKPDKFISVWQYIEGATTKEDQWYHLETSKSNK